MIFVTISQGSAVKLPWNISGSPIDIQDNLDMHRKISYICCTKLQ